jgi:hypothetical protein
MVKFTQVLKPGAKTIISHLERIRGRENAWTPVRAVRLIDAAREKSRSRVSDLLIIGTIILWEHERPLAAVGMRPAAETTLE